MRISAWCSDLCLSDLKSWNEQYRISTDAYRRRPSFSNSEILETTARATTVENDPSAYLAGESMGGSSGSCVPLPPGSGSEGYYESTCNSGAKVEERAMPCTISMVPAVQTVDSYHYSLVPHRHFGKPLPRYATISPPLSQ